MTNTTSNTHESQTGMDWYNGCSEAERARWHAAAGSAVPADAYRAFCAQADVSLQPDMQRDGKRAAESVPADAPAAPPAVAGPSDAVRSFREYIAMQYVTEAMTLAGMAWRAAPAAAPQAPAEAQEPGAHPVYQARARTETSWADVNADGYRAAMAMRSMDARILYTHPAPQQAAPQAPAAPCGESETMQALSDLTNALRERHYGRMPEEVQRAYDKAWTIVFAGPRVQSAPATPSTITIPDAAYCALQYVEHALAAIANREELVDDTIERMDTIGKASKRARVALTRLQAVAHHFDADAAPAAPAVDATAEHAAEYNRWISFHAAGDGDYDDFLRRELKAKEGGSS